MSKTLLVPERYAKAAQRSAEKETSPDKITSKEKLPEPSGWRILILPYRGKVIGSFLVGMLVAALK